MVLSLNNILCQKLTPPLHSEELRGWESSTAHRGHLSVQGPSLQVSFLLHLFFPWRSRGLMRRSSWGLCVGMGTNALSNPCRKLETYPSILIPPPFPPSLPHSIHSSIQQFLGNYSKSSLTIINRSCNLKQNHI